MDEPNLPLRRMFCLDALSHDPERLAQATYLEHTVREVAKMAGMAILHLTTSDIGVDTKQLGREPQPWESGYSTLALISTSHIALHTWPKLSYFMFDIASCKPFNAADLRAHLAEAFDVSEVIYEATSHAVELMSFRRTVEKQAGAALGQ